jgi:hypothetical protein
MLSMKRLTLPALAILLAARGPALAQQAHLTPPAVSRPGAQAINQQLADAVAQELRASGVLKSYRIDVTVLSGQVELTGMVGDEGQRDEAMRLARGVPGVADVKSKLAMTNPGTVQQTQLMAQETLPTPRKSELPGEPVPSFRATIPQHRSQQMAPPLPPYAWPTYAPYNNYSRVAYPEFYPYNAFPFIGPVHPFPKVPLGWRCVKLEWDDGHWWYSSHAQKRDWWHLRYW